MFQGFEENATSDQKLRTVENALYKNQKEHSHFRACHVDLEESITNVSHALDYVKENINLIIGKKPSI